MNTSYVPNVKFFTKRRSIIIVSHVIKTDFTLTLPFTFRATLLSFVFIMMFQTYFYLLVFVDLGILKPSFCALREILRSFNFRACCHIAFHESKDDQTFPN